MVRWTFTYGLSSYTFEMNPNKATIQTAQEAVTIVPIRQRAGLSTKVAAPRSFTTSGVLRTQAQFLTMQTWANSGVRIGLVDHQGRHYVVRITDFQPTMEAPMRRAAPWRHTYTLNLVIYSGPDAA